MFFSRKLSVLLRFFFSRTAEGLFYHFLCFIIWWPDGGLSCVLPRLARQGLFELPFFDKRWARVNGKKKKKEKKSKSINQSIIL